jgi:hypothetical protein
MEKPGAAAMIGATEAREIAINYLLIGMTLGGGGWVAIALLASALHRHYWAGLVVFPLIGLLAGLLLLPLPQLS